SPLLIRPLHSLPTQIRETNKGEEKGFKEKCLLIFYSSLSSSLFFSVNKKKRIITIYTSKILKVTRLFATERRRSSESKSDEIRHTDVRKWIEGERNEEIRPPWVTEVLDSTRWVHQIV
ncbi:hypothetical protein Tsubulata_032166, partial [Turnera subulata]